jgi:cyclophilin family peptidyl-prolyl cis-trans isomerase
VLARIKDKYPNDVQVVYRHFPLISIHDLATLSAQAAEAAGLQGEFWVMHDLLYATQSEWSPMSEAAFLEWAIQQAVELGLDEEQFAKDLTSDGVATLVAEAYEHGVASGLPGTPLLLINGQLWPNDMPYSEAYISAITELTLLEKIQFTSCPQMTIDPSKQYVATISTEKGDVIIELFPDKAPIAVNNFIFLAEEGWYDGVTFHRVLPGSIAQAGDPSGTGFGGPGYAFVNESSDIAFDEAGLVAMANAGPDSNGSQFFITYRPRPDLDGGYTIFGRVISGMDVAESIRARDPSSGLDLPPGDQISTITIDTR